ncbi:hypothetical protein F4804DRAFT_347725 [Jackrogersella minutella]|nr:hypothetical protein F4804DRAFT_347725 [Jackrogersella minutella]
MKEMVRPLEAFAASHPELLATPISSSGSTSTPLTVFDTIYGLRVIKKGEGGSSTYSVELVSPTASTDDKRQSFRHYRILPDWLTTFFWKDLKYFEEKSDSMIEDTHLTAFCPILAKSFLFWKSAYDDEYEELEMYQRNDHEVFPDLERRVDWCVEGFLMACWLVLQSDVDTVEYYPFAKAYELTQDNLDQKIQEFLDDIQAALDGTVLLESRYEWTETGSEMEVESEMGSGSDTEMESHMETESTMKVDWDTEMELDMGLDTDSGTESDTDMDLETDMEPEIKVEPETETETKMDIDSSPVTSEEE